MEPERLLLNRLICLNSTLSRIACGIVLLKSRLLTRDKFSRCFSNPISFGMTPPPTPPSIKEDYEWINYNKDICAPDSPIMIVRTYPSSLQAI